MSRRYTGEAASKFHSLSASTLDGSEWSTSRSGRLTPVETSGTH